MVVVGTGSGGGREGSDVSRQGSERGTQSDRSFSERNEDDTTGTGRGNGNHGNGAGGEPELGAVFGRPSGVQGAFGGRAGDTVRTSRPGRGDTPAPALAAADISLAMGSGTDIAMEVAGVTLMRPDPRLVADAISVSRATGRKIYQNLF